jgi:hypothetical protein
MASVQAGRVAESVAAETGNAQQNASLKTVGQIPEKRLVESGNAQRKTVGQTVGHFVGQIPQSASAGNDLLGNAQQIDKGNAQQKIVGQIAQKLLGKSANAQQITTPRTEWFRYEMDFRERKKGGYHVIIRRRLKWSAARYAPTIAYCFCANLTDRQVKSVKDGKFTPAAVAALQNGGISHEIIKKLLERIGKGNGKRAAELTDHERLILSRIESGLASSNGRRNDSAGDARRRLAVPRPHGEFTEVPNVH